MADWTLSNISNVLLPFNSVPNINLLLFYRCFSFQFPFAFPFLFYSTIFPFLFFILFLPYLPIMKHVSTGADASNAVSKVSRTLLFHFREAIKTTNFRAHFSIGRLRVKQFLKLVMSSSTVRAEEIADVRRAKTSTRSKPLKLTMFASFSDLNFHEIGTEQVLQILQVSLANATYAEKDPHVRPFFYTVFRAGKSFVALSNEVQLCRQFLTLHDDAPLLQ